MSLLIDALRRAEQAKHEAAPGLADGERERSADQGSASGGSAARPLPPGLSETAESYLAAQPRPRATEAPRTAEQPRATTPDPEAAARDSVRSLFEAKTPPPPPLLRILAGAGVLAALAVAAWVWWEVQPGGTGLGPGPALTAPPPRALPPAARDVTPPDPALLPAAVRPAPEPSVASKAATRAPSAPTAGTPAPRPPASPAAPSPAKAAVAAVPPGAPARGRPAAPSGEGIRESAPPASPGLGPIRRGSPPPGPPPKLVAAYAAYGEGRLADAGQLYREVLADLPLNRDAINGLGAVALREGRPDEAERWFRRALALDPQDPVAAAGLANLTGPRAPLDTESRLKHLLAAAPDAAPAQFALGNALAVQQRWSEAQQAYFRAYALDGDNPDYLFNLAVSLDHLQQKALAGRFYRQALEAATRRPAAFDPAAARARLDALSASRSPP